MAAVHVELPAPFQPLGPPQGQRSTFPAMAASRTAARVKASPTFTSSDLFTPFSAPHRVNLPCIAKFVRPSYGKDNTWGTETASYGGVGGAAHQMAKTEEGATSRSHRHYGTGCTNCYAPQQPYRVTQLSLSQCRPCDQLLPRPLLTDEVVKKQQEEEYPGNHMFTSHKSVFAVFPSAFTTPDKSRRKALSPRTIEALNELRSALYSTTSYQEHHCNHAFITRRDTPKEQREEEAETSTNPTSPPRATPTSPDPPRKVILTEAGGGRDLQPQENVTTECHCEGCCQLPGSGQTVNREQCGDGDVCGCDSLGEETDGGAVCDDDESNGVTMDTDKTATGDCDTPYNWSRTSLGYAAVFKADQLQAMPEHFRRNSSKYTRNRLPHWPCYVPYYLFSKHTLLPQTLLPQTMVSLPGSFKCSGFREKGSDDGEGGQENVAADDSANQSENRGTSKAGDSTPQTGAQQQKHTLHQSQLQYSSKNVNLVKLPTLTHTTKTWLIGRRAQPSLSESAGKDEILEGGDVPPLSRMLAPLGSRVSHRIGLRYKSDAHARYHKLYPDPIPDLRNSRVSGKKHFFHSYHASVFRG